MEKLKTSQRGSVLSVAIIIVAVSILVIVGLFFITSSSLNSARSQKVQYSSETTSPTPKSGDQLTYTEPSGLFSFTYSADLEITKYTPTNGFTAILSQWPFLINISQKTTQGTNGFNIEVDLDETVAFNFEKAAHMKGSTNFSKENVTIGNISGYRMYYESVIFGKTVKEVEYVFALTYNTSKVFLYEKITAWGDSAWLSKAEPIAKSIKIDVTKTPQAVDTLKNSAVVQGMQQGEQKAELTATDGEVKSLMAQIRQDAENSYYSLQNYSTVCTSSTNLNQVKDKTGSKVKCSAGADYYVISAQLPSGSFYCLDKRGYIGKATAFHTGNSCLR